MVGGSPAGGFARGAAVVAGFDIDRGDDGAPWSQVSRELAAMMDRVADGEVEVSDRLRGERQCSLRGENRTGPGR